MQRNEHLRANLSVFDMTVQRFSYASGASVKIFWPYVTTFKGKLNRNPPFFPLFFLFLLFFPSLSLLLSFFLSRALKDDCE